MPADVIKIYQIASFITFKQYVPHLVWLFLKPFVSAINVLGTFLRLFVKPSGPRLNYSDKSFIVKRIEAKNNEIFVKGNSILKGLDKTKQEVLGENILGGRTFTSAEKTRQK